MKKMLFIMNPLAGTKRGSKYLPEVISIFNRAGYQVNTYMTAGPGDGIQAVRRMAEYADLVVCAGGDGTFNETVTGLLQGNLDLPVGYLPCGSTNDFAASLHLSADLLQAARDIVYGVPVRYDIGRFADRYFSYVASFGAFTRASYVTPQTVKNALGHTAYILEGIQELSQIRKVHVRFEAENQIIEDDFLFGAISNSTSVGGILTLDPKQVDMRDGKFELLLVRAPKDFSELSECLRALQTQKYNCGMITFLSASNIQVTADPSMPWTLDGEKENGHSLIHVENLQHAIQLVQNQEGL